MEIRTLAEGEKITQDLLQDLVSYDPDTGILLWQERNARHFTATSRSAQHQASHWNSRWAGKKAFNCMTAKGYLRGSLNSRAYLAHRIIWIITTGQDAVDEIDHKNGNKCDNRITNLRAADRFLNCQNRSSVLGSTSNYIGVSWSAHMGKWRSQIIRKNKPTHLGYFDCEIDAAKAYDSHSRKVTKVVNRLNFPLEL